MAWLKFEQLDPAQSVVALQQLAVHVDEPFLKKPQQREFLVVDGAVKGSRLIYTDKDRKLFDVLGIGQRDVKSKGDLQGWTGGPERWSLDV